MPKKPSTLFVMREYPSLSTRKYHKMTIEDVRRPGKAKVHFRLRVLDNPDQAGRTITYELPTVMAPGSPLCKFLADGFGIHLDKGQSLDPATLIGRALEARFSRRGKSHDQQIEGVRAFTEPNGEPANPPSTGENTEPSRGLG